MLVPDITHLTIRDRISVKEYNSRGQSLQSITRSLGTNAYSDSAGLLIRSRPFPVEESAVIAIILKSLRRKNIELGETLRDWYEIEFVHDPFPIWTSAKPWTKDTQVKNSGEVYIAIRDVPIGIAITNTSYWAESSGIKAWVYTYPYEDSLIESIPWFDVGEKVEVIYDVEKWWLKKTVTRVQTGEDENIVCSLYWNAEERRAMSVYR